jgi:CheY-like chemotaxis protein
LLSRSRILVVDPSSDSREVLCALLQRGGAETVETARVRHACLLAQTQRPDVIVLDGDGREQAAEEVLDDLGRFASRSSTPIVVLGTLKRHTSPLATGHFVSKPYHYAALIRRIEELLGNRA